MQLLKWSTALGLIGSAIAAPLSLARAVSLERRAYQLPSLSTTPPAKGFGVGQFGSFKDVKFNVNDPNILQFALMLEVAQTLFYQTAFSQFSIEEMVKAGLSESQIIELRNAFVVEQTHVEVIVTVLQSLNIQPLNQPVFFFQFNSIVDFIQQLAIQEVYFHPLNPAHKQYWYKCLSRRRTLRVKQGYPRSSRLHHGSRSPSIRLHKRNPRSQRFLKRLRNAPLNQRSRVPRRPIHRLRPKRHSP